MAKKTLKERVEQCRKDLKELEIKNPKHYFCLKFPEYKPKGKDDTEAINKIDNLFYGKIQDETFTQKLESFVQFNRVHYKD